MNSVPLISLITVCFNDGVRLRKTIASVRDQVFKNFEYIVIDGASKDDTGNIVRESGNLISVYLSERDAGLYDAMNKGLNLAKGEYICFLNAGDLLSSDQALLDFSKLANSNPSANGILAPVFVEYPETGYRRQTQVRNLSVIYSGIPTCHQGMLYRAKLLKECPFDLNYKIAADFNQYLEFVKKFGKDFAVLLKPFAIVEAGGVSDIRRFKSRCEYIRSTSKQLGVISGIICGFWQSFFMLYDLLSSLGKSILTKRTVEKIRELKS